MDYQLKIGDVLDVLGYKVKIYLITHDEIFVSYCDNGNVRVIRYDKKDVYLSIKVGVIDVIKGNDKKRTHPLTSIFK